jgi:hypothetical protein
MFMMYGSASRLWSRPTPFLDYAPALELAQCRRPQRIMAQPVVIDQILVNRQSA